MLRRAVKSSLVHVLSSRAAVAARLHRNRALGRVTILNLHDVRPPLHNNSDDLTPELFGYLIKWMKQRFQFTTFERLSSEAGNDRPLAILSFDDGYASFLEIAHPVLRRSGIAANLNIIPQCAETGRPPLNLEISDLVKVAGDAELAESRTVQLFMPGKRRFNLLDRIALSNRLKSCEIGEQENLLSQLRDEIPRTAETTRKMLNPQQIKYLADFHEIGAHSYAHATMTEQGQEYFVEDLDACRRWFDCRLGRKFSVYAFPNGAADQKKIDHLKQSGVDHVLLVGERFGRVAAFVQRRFTLHARSMAECRFRASGALAL